MPLTLSYPILTFAIVLVVFLLVNRVRGMKFALAAAGLALMSLFALFVAVVVLTTNSMQ